MSAMVNTGARLDRLPISSFHYRIFWLIGAGMFFDGYDLYVAGPVLGTALKTGFSTLAQNGWFLSLTFIGMTLGSLLAGFLGDRYGRRFTYQFNLMIFGLASLAAAFAPDIDWLNALRFVMGVGLGAEIVVGYGTMTEFVPPQVRGKWMAFMAFVVVSGLPATALTRPVHRSNLRLAPAIRHRRDRCADRLVSAQEAAGIAALARGAGPDGGGRDADAGHRERGRRAASRCRRRRWPSRCRLSALPRSPARSCCRS